MSKRARNIEKRKVYSKVILIDYIYVGRVSVLWIHNTQRLGDRLPGRTSQVRTIMYALKKAKKKKKCILHCKFFCSLPRWHSNSMHVVCINNFFGKKSNPDDDNDDQLLDNGSQSVGIYLMQAQHTTVIFKTSVDKRS